MSGMKIDDPVTLSKALASTRFIPGDTLALRGGRYTGDWVLPLAISGTPEKPITIRPYQNEPVIIDGSFQIFGHYIHIYDLEITDSRDAHLPQTLGVYAVGTGTSVYGCYIHDVKAGGGIEWFGSGPGEVSENWIQDCGYQDVNNGWHGYCIYDHNESPGEHLCQRNLMRPKLEKYSLHIFSASNIALNDNKVYDNVFDGAVHAGGGQGLKHFCYERNVHNDAWVQLGRYLWDKSKYQNDGTIIKDNIFMRSYFTIDTDNQQPPQPHPNPWANLTESGNLAWSPYRATDYDRDGYTVEAAPAHYERFIPFTISARWSGIQVTLTDGVFSAEMVAK
jgi:hypothetical protein